MESYDKVLDYIKENFNMGVGRGAKILNTMLGAHITLQVPQISIIRKEKDLNLGAGNAQVATVDLPFHGVLNGTSRLIFSNTSALRLVQELAGDHGAIGDAQFDPISEGVLKEIGNIVLNSVVGVLCNSLHIHLKYTVPVFNEMTVEDFKQEIFHEKEVIGIVATIHFSAEDIDVQGDVMTIFKTDSFDQLVELIRGKL